MANISRDLFEPMFVRELQLLQNPICAKCDAQIKSPLLPWIVGDRFSDTAERLLFVGKPHRGEPDNKLASGMIDGTELVSAELWEKSWPYWSYTRQISQNIYGENAQEFIALSNLIKCTNVGAKSGVSSSTDDTSFQMAECCVLKLGVIWREIELLQAKTIIFYTYGLFREVLQHIPVALNGSTREITSPNHRVCCGNKHLGWWERSCATSWSDSVRILIVGHPERMQAIAYVDLLTTWIRGTN